VETPIFLSILGYEDELRKVIGSIGGSTAMSRIRSLLGGVQGVHIDVIRPPYSDRPRFAKELVEKLCRDLSGTPMEIHVMAREPLSILTKVRAACVAEPVPVATVHIETFKDSGEAAAALMEIKDHDFRAGVAIDLATPVEALSPRVVGEAEIIHVMSVPAGKGGQRFNPESVEKISRLKEAYPSTPIAVDGGVDEETGRLCIAAGVDTLIVGSRITGRGDPLEALLSLRKGLKGP
jgi:ribulose-phosphate 3-epimerase